jgi:putative transposase
VRRYVYVWADGDLQARMGPQAECMLVLIGAMPEGKKELIGFQTGMRESAQSWKELLRFEGARLVDRAGSRRRRWRARLLESSRRDVPGNASSTMLAAQDVERARQVSEIRSAQCTQRPARIWLAPDRATAETAIGVFAEKYTPKYDKAVECLIKAKSPYAGQEYVPFAAVRAWRTFSP